MDMKKMIWGIGGGLLSLALGFGLCSVLKINVNPESMKQEVERNIENTKGTFRQATNAF